MIHYMHDKYYYEAAEMALIDTDVRRTFATGIAGFSHVVDSLSAIKYAKVKVIRDEDGIAVDFETEGDFPRYGNNDERADKIAVDLLKTFMLSSSIATHTEIQSLQLLSLQSHQMLFTVRLQVHFLTAEKQANHFHRVLTQATVQSRTVFLLHLTLLLSFLTSTLLTVFQILRQSTRVLSDTTMTSVLTTS